MKINKAKLLVGTLAVASVAATVGSISGTVAWFQYSTRVTAAYSGAAAHVSENLQIRVYKPAVEGHGQEGDDDYVAPQAAIGNDAWKADLTIADVQEYVAAARGIADYDLRPVTSGNALANGGIATSFYTSPVYQKSGDYNETNWGTADKMDYVELPIQLRIAKNDGGVVSYPGNQKIFLTDLTLDSKTVAGKKNITPALRVSFDAENDDTFSQNGEEIATFGALDLNGDGKEDLEEGYEWQNLDTMVYGSDDAKEVTSDLSKANAQNPNGLIANDTDPSHFIGKELGSTDATTGIFDVTVRIYLEGWQKLENSELAAIKAAVVDKSEVYADIAEMEEAVALQENPFVPENGKVYKTGDGNTYKWTIGEAPAAVGAFSEVTIKDPMQAMWLDADYAKAAFYVGMRFANEANY